MSAPTAARPPRPTEVRVWAVRLADLAPEAARCLAWLAPDERERAARFRHESDRRRYVLARGALRALLGGCLETDPGSLRFVYGPQGKPALVSAPGAPDLQFSLAHAGGRALCAVALGRAVGVDLEPIDPSLDALALGRHVLSAGELAALAAAPPPERPGRFLALWTSKEALVKAHGAGLSLDPRRIDLAAPRACAPVEGAPRLVALPDGGLYRLGALDVGPGYAASYALAGAEPPAHIGLATIRALEDCNAARPPSF